MTTAVTANSDIRSLIQSEGYQKQFAMVLPKHLTPERLTRVALTALTKTPKLAQCSQASLMACILDCASMGLEPDGRRAHLIPFGTTCTLIVDYKGIAELVMRSGLVSYIHADVVCEHDQFEENMGRVTVHKIDRKAPRGQPYAAYSKCVMKDGNESFEVMGKEEIEKIRNNSQGYKRGGKDSPWSNYPEEMWKKTVFRRHSKWLPLSPEIRDALDKDADAPIDVNAEVEIGAPVINAPQVGEGKKLESPGPAKPKTKPKPKPKPKPKAEPEPAPEPEPEPGEGMPQEAMEPEEMTQPPEPKKGGLKQLDDPESWKPGQ